MWSGWGSSNSLSSSSVRTDHEAEEAEDEEAE
jgi:hypothetical protein